MKLTDPIVVQIASPPAIVQRDTSRAEQVVQQAINLDRSIASNQFELGDLFVEIIDGDYFHVDGSETLQEFLSKNGFELSPREVRYRETVSRVSKRIGITREQQLKAGISKMKAITELNPDLDVVNPTTGNTEKLADVMRGLVIDAGAGRKLKDIRKMVDDLKGKSEGEENVLVWWNMPVFKDRQQFLEETVQMVVQLSGDTVGEEDKEARDISRATAVERIFAEARSGFGLEMDEVGAQGTFEDEAYVEDENGRQFEEAD